MRALFITNSITQRDDESLDRYFNDIKKIGMISAKEELLLGPRIRRGETAALSLLVTTNLRFVVTVAKQYQSRGVSISDLINEGNLGLISAARRFDETKGYKFISFAVWSVRQAIISALAEQSRMVHIPYNQISLMGKFNKVAEKLEQAYARRPTVNEVAELMELDPERLEDLMLISGNEISLDKPLSDDMGETLLDVLPSNEALTDDHLLKDSKRQVISHCLGILKPREREIIEQSFGLFRSEPVPLEEIARKLNFTIEHTRRLKDRALLQIRNSCHAGLLRSYF